jgi:glycine/D-amino acid oxidase-like deaminating enzyme
MDPLPVEVDLAVIGGGVAGAAVAWHAARNGLSVVLLERDRLASRASGRNDGQMLLGMGEHFNRLVGQWGRDRARTLWRFLTANQAAMSACIGELGIACDLVEGGGLRLASTTSEWSELRESANLLGEEGVPHRLLDEDEVATTLPLACGFHGGLYFDREALFDPAAFVRGLAERARQAGASVRECTEVVAVSGQLGELRLHTAAGDIDARCLVHCTNALARELDPSGFLRRVVFPFRGQILATPRLPAAIAEHMPPWAMSTNFGYEYWRLHGGQMTLGGMRWSVPGEETGTTDDRSLNPAIGVNLRRWLERHFPDIARHGVEREWTGIMAGTPDGLPLAGELPGRPGEYALLAFNGYGMSFAFLAGQCLVEMIVTGRSSVEGASLFRPDRFARC